MWSTPNAVPHVATAPSHAGEVGRHDVGVPLDDHRPALGRDGLLRGVEPVEHLGLLVDRRLGGVEVLGRDAVVVEQAPGAEADRVAGRVADRPDEAAPEPVVEAAAPPPREPPGDHLVLGEAALAQVPGQGLAVARCEADAEPLGRAAVEAALAEEVAPRPGLGVRRVEEDLRIELLGDAVGLQQPRAPAERDAVAVGTRTVLVVELEPELGGEALDGLGEGEVLHLLDEGEDVAALATAEAVVRADRRAHREARRLLVVERAEPLERPDTGGAEGHVVAHDVLDGRALLDRRDVLGPDPTRHSPSSVCRESRSSPNGTSGGAGRWRGRP